MFIIKFPLEEQKGLLEGPLALSKLWEMDQQFDPAPWTKENWKSSKDVVFLYEDGHEIRGFLVFRPLLEDSFAHLLKFLVLPPFRKRGNGKRLLSFSLDFLEKQGINLFFLEVWEKNPAVALYLKLGFKKIHQIRNYYGKTRSAMVMERRLK